MAVAVETADTFNAYTDRYILAGLHDQVFTGTPLLTELGTRIRGFQGTKFEGRIQIGEITNHWYDPDADVDLDLDFTTPEIGAEFSYGLKYAYEAVRLPAHQVDRQSGEKNIRMLVAYTNNAKKSLRKDLNAKLLALSGSGPGDHSANQPTSLWDICNDHNAEYGKAAIGGITADGTTHGYWRAHIMEGQATYATAVSPSLQNVGKMVTRIAATVGEKPDLIVVDEDFYDVLEAQLTPIQMQTTRSNRFRDWGYDSFTVKGVPVIWDPDMPGLSYAGSTDRHTCGGSEALFINWATMFGIKDAKWNFAFQPGGWYLDPTKIPAYYNSLFSAINYVTTMRRAQGHMFNVNLSQDPADFTKGVITLPVAS